MLKRKFEVAQAALVGSNWVVKRFEMLFATTYTLKDARGSSYTPTPEVLCNSKLGLINIKNEDQECFKYCMLYRQTGKVKHCDRITVLKKVEDKYKWEGIKFTTSFEDVETLKRNSEVCVSMLEHTSKCHAAGAFDCSTAWCPPLRSLPSLMN